MKCYSGTCNQHSTHILEMSIEATQHKLKLHVKHGSLAEITFGTIKI